MWDPPWPEIKPMFPTLSGKFLILDHQESSNLCYFRFHVILSSTFIDLSSVQFSSVAQSCPTVCDPMDRSTPGLPVHQQLPEFTQTPVLASVMPSSHLILCGSLLLRPPITPSIRSFSNESNLRMRWPKYWSFSFSISPSN